ncbi:TlpA family protein disulfide reductase [Patescibacteria group bacterium]|nr:TlpA family protein disulfide reductase [Patescibacteria group bacterium]
MNIKKIFTIAAICCAFTILVFGVIAFSKNEDASPAIGNTVGTAIGNRAPDFTIKIVDGQTITLKDFIGKKALVITSTASWCPTCIIEAHNFAPVYPQVKDEVEFLSVSIDPTDGNTKLKVFQASTDTPWFYTHPNLRGVHQMIINYKLTRFEITYIIDKKGIIRFKDREITKTDTLRNALLNL